MGESEGAGINALCVPEFTFSKVMRPYDGFEVPYQGQGVWDNPIMFSEGGQAYDEIAASGANGYDPNLVKGLPCKVGQRVIVVLPLFPMAEGEVFVPRYIWKFAWRMRNLHDFRNARTTRYNYSLPKQGQGTPDTLGPNPGPRVVIPVALQSIIYNQAEPNNAMGGPPLINHLLVEHLQPRMIDIWRPIMPDGAVGIVQQGIIDGAGTPLFAVHEMQAIADELLIGLYREEEQWGVNWDFAGADRSLSVFLDPTTPDLGVYVCRGISP